MRVRFQILDEEGNVLNSAEQEVDRHFSMMDLLNKSIPGWEQTVQAFFEKAQSGEYTPVFKEKEDKPPSVEKPPAEDPEGLRMRGIK